jgi:group I intron endonuclease
MKRCGIYLLKHRASGRCYVGQSIDIDARLSGHARGRSGSGIVGSAIAKYGWTAFDATVLQLCSRDALDTAEQNWISRMASMSPAGYNLTNGGQKYKQVTDDVRAKISEATRLGLTAEVIAKRAAKLRGKPKSPEHRAKLAAVLARAKESATYKSRPPISEETRAKQAAAKLGKKASAETRRRISEAKLKRGEQDRASGIVRRLSAETKAKMSAARRAWYERNPGFKRARSEEGRFLPKDPL